MKDFKKILVPTDYSDLSLSAIDYAMAFSHVFGSQIYLLHTLDSIPILALDAMDMTTETVIFETEKNARNDLHNFAVARMGQLPGVIEVVRKGVAEDQIVKYAQEESIDLIVMATHGRSGIAHVLMGSVAERVVQRSLVPVLTVKPASMDAHSAFQKRGQKYSGAQRK